MRKTPWQLVPLWGPILAPLGQVYAWVMAARRRRFCAEPSRVTHLGRPTISVGNLVVGGTGKTPFVVAVLERLPRDLRPALVLSRGYGAKLESPFGLLDEEGCLILRRHPDAIVAQGADRIEAAEPYIQSVAAIVLDDGAQHLKIARDLDILLFDPSDLARPRYCLPAGPWRESLDAAESAQLFVLTRTDEVPRHDLERAQAILRGRFPQTPQILSRHRPARLQGPNAESRPPESLQNAEVLAISGIARPESFHRSLRALGAKIVASLEFSDHQAYGFDEVERIVELATEMSQARLITTEKDAAKLAEVLPSEIDLRLEVLEIEIELLEGAEKLDALLIGLLAHSLPGDKIQ